MEEVKSLEEVLVGKTLQLPDGRSTTIVRLALDRAGYLAYFGSLFRDQHLYLFQDDFIKEHLNFHSIFSLGDKFYVLTYNKVKLNYYPETAGFTITLEAI